MLAGYRAKLKVNNGNTSKRSVKCSKLTINTPKQRRSGVFIVNFEQFLHFIPLFPLLNLNKHLSAGYNLRWRRLGDNFQDTKKSLILIFNHLQANVSWKRMNQLNGFYMFATLALNVFKNNERCYFHCFPR